MSRPPLERPRMAKCSGEVYFLSIRYWAAANQSSKTFCFFSNMPCSCQCSPYSSPPRRLGMANQPPCSIHQAQAGFHAGVIAELKAAVAGHQQALGPVLLQAFFAGNEHGDLGAVFGFEEDLLQLVLAGVERDLGLEEDFAFAGGGVDAIDGGRRDEGLKAEESVAIGGLPASRIAEPISS